MNNCIVFVCNKKYINKFIFTVNQLRKVGLYDGDIVLIVGNDLMNENDLLIRISNQFNVIVRKINDIIFSSNFHEIQKSLARPSHWYDKIFQYHKIYIFSPFFKRWEKIMYIDCGMHVFSDINPLFSILKNEVFVANRDGIDGEYFGNDGEHRYDENMNIPGQSMLLASQFCNHKNYTTELNKNYSTDLINAFQTTFLFFDSKIINDIYTSLI